MINYTSSKQVTPDEFKTEFELNLDHKNRWVVLSMNLPWDELVRPYIKKMSVGKGAAAVNPRIVIGSLYIKHRLSLSDVETIQQIRENPYMQYFLGLNSYHSEPLFDSNLFVEIRKRMGIEEYDKMDLVIRNKAKEEDKKEDKKKKAKDIKNRGELKIDATVADQYIKFPTDLDLLSQCRVWTETIIDEIFPQTLLEKKPRTYRQEARQRYLKVVKKKKRTEKEVHNAKKQQLNYIKRNLRYIEEMLDMFEMGAFPLCYKSQRYMWIVREVYRQQLEMYTNKVNHCEDRIVSLHQPHVRPIVRGKQKAKVEFGSKLSIGLDNGFTRLERLSWNAFNECGDLQSQVEAYKSIHDYYPEVVQADKIYFTKENRKFLEERNIRFTGVPLGRPSKEKESYYQKKKKKKESNRRNQVEGKFGQGKNAYNLNKIRARLKETSESWVCEIFFAMNVIHYYSKYCC